MKRTFKQITHNNHKYNILSLPNTNYFKFEVINMYGSIIEKYYQNNTGKNVYGLSHLIEHLGFRNCKDYSTKELLHLIKSEGTYNASTDTTRINYWFQTTMEKSFLGINLVMNYAFNDLTKISQEEFDIEKKVVYNEAKRYADDDQTMFSFNVYPALLGYDKEDNVIGIPETIDTFTLEDAINIKDIFLQNDDVFYNITYDPTILTEKEIINQIEYEILRFKKEKNENFVSKELYMSHINTINIKNIKIENESTQMLTALNLDVVTNKVTADACNSYLSQYAKDTSLNDIIREQNGLTYGIQLDAHNVDYKNYTYFGCDVSVGSEGLLLKLFKESINKSVDNWNEETHKYFMNTRKLKRTLNLINQKNYDYWFSLAVWDPELLEQIKYDAERDLDSAYTELDKLFCSFEQMQSYLNNVVESVNTEKYNLVSNY